MAVDWDAVAETWEHNEAVQTFADQVFASLSELTQVSNKTILDFGCGTGILSQQLAPMAKSIVALDSSEAMIEVLEEKNLSNVEPVVDMLTRGLVAQHPAFRGQFDLVVASSVCGFIPALLMRVTSSTRFWKMMVCSFTGTGKQQTQKRA